MCLIEVLRVCLFQIVIITSYSTYTLVNRIMEKYAYDCAQYELVMKIQKREES